MSAIPQRDPSVGRASAGEPRIIPHCSVPVLFQIDKAAQFAAVRTPLRLPHGVANALPFSLTRYAAAVVATRETGIRHATNVTAGPNASVKVERIRSPSDLNIARK